MPWYDVFSRWYDTSLEALYRVQRERAAAALDLQEGHRVLEVPVGTGQSLPHLRSAVGEAGLVVGVDLSEGMLARARERATAEGWKNVRLIHRDVTSLDREVMSSLIGDVQVDAIQIFLGMSVFPDPRAALAALWPHLRPGGVVVLVDVYNPSPGLQGKMVEWMAQADLSRRSWELLEEIAIDVTREDLPSTWQHGGQMWLARGRKA